VVQADAPSLQLASEAGLPGSCDLPMPALALCVSSDITVVGHLASLAAKQDFLCLNWTRYGAESSSRIKPEHGMLGIVLRRLGSSGGALIGHFRAFGVQG
jgi:hypothetical protein